jgi:hypothetical protein
MISQLVPSDVRRAFCHVRVHLCQLCSEHCVTLGARIADLPSTPAITGARQRFSKAHANLRQAGAGLMNGG